MAGIQKLFQSRFARQVLTLVSGTAAAQLITLAITPVLFRLYGQADLDALAAFSGLFFSLVTVASLRYEQAIAIVPDRTRAVHLVRLSALVALAFAGVIFLALVLFGKPIAERLGQPLLQQHPWILPVALFGGGLYLVGTLWFTREQQFKVTAQTTVTQAVAMAIIQLGGGLVSVGSGALTLAIGLAVGRSAGVLAFLNKIRGFPEWKSAWSTAEVGELAKRYRNFPIFNSPSMLANNLGLQLPALMLTALYPLGSAAAFYGAMRVLGAPMSLIGAAIGQAYQGEAARIVREEPASLVALFDRTVKNLAKVAVVLVLVGLAAPWWLPWILGPAGGPAGVWAAILAPGLGLGLICSPVSMTANVLERLRGQMVLDFTRTLVTAICFAVPALQKGTADQAVWAYGVATAILYVVYLAYYRSCAASAGRLPSPVAAAESTEEKP